MVVGSIGVAAKIAFDSLEFAGKRADLSATANIESMEGLRKSTRGLMTETELLTVAAGIQQGIYKLSQKEMESVTGAMTALAERGNDAAAVTEAFTAALVTGKTKGLKAFGIEVYEGGNRLETHNAILQKAADLAKEFAASTLDGADKMSQAKVTFADATDSLKVSIAETAESLTPMVSGLADVVRLLAETGAAGPLAIGALGAAITGNPAIGALLAFGAAGGFSDMSQAMLDPKAYAARMRGATTGGTMQGAAALSAAQRLQRQTMTLVPGLEMDSGSVGVVSLPDLKKAEAAAAKFHKEQDEYFVKQGKVYTEHVEGLRDALIQAGFAGEGRQEEADRLKYEFGRSKTSAVSRSGGTGEYDLSSPDGGAMDEAYESFRARGGGKTALERMVGPVEDFDMYGQLFNTLADSMGEAFEALVTGSESAGTAMKKMIGTGMMATAKQLFVEGIKHQVLAIGSLAGEDYKGFVLHQTAAAKSFAGALIVGGIAGGLGGSGSTGGGGGRSASAPSYEGPRSGSYKGGSNVTIVYGDQFADDSPRNRQRTAQKLVSKALGSSGGTYS